MVEKMGWSEKKAMMINGHKTNAMLFRYDIIPTTDIKERLGRAAPKVPERSAAFPSGVRSKTRSKIASAILVGWPICVSY